MIALCATVSLEGDAVDVKGLLSPSMVHAVGFCYFVDDDIKALFLTFNT